MSCLADTLEELNSPLQTQLRLGTGFWCWEWRKEEGRKWKQIVPLAAYTISTSLNIIHGFVGRNRRMHK